LALPPHVPSWQIGVSSTMTSQPLYEDGQYRVANERR